MDGIADVNVSKENKKLDLDVLSEETAIAMAQQSEQIDINVQTLPKDRESKSVDFVRNTNQQTVNPNQTTLLKLPTMLRLYPNHVTVVASL